MGQYHKVVNLDKREFLHPHKFDDGLKLLEFGCSSDGTMTALAILLAASCKGGARGGGDVDAPKVAGRWAGDRIAIIGDYAEADDVPGVNAEEISNALGGGEYTDISAMLLPVLAEYCSRHINSAKLRPDFVLTAGRK